MLIKGFYSILFSLEKLSRDIILIFLGTLSSDIVLIFFRKDV